MTVRAERERERGKGDSDDLCNFSFFFMCVRIYERVYVRLRLFAEEGERARTREISDKRT